MTRVPLLCTLCFCSVCSDNSRPRRNRFLNFRVRRVCGRGVGRSRQLKAARDEYRLLLLCVWVASRAWCVPVDAHRSLQGRTRARHYPWRLFSSGPGRTGFDCETKATTAGSNAQCAATFYACTLSASFSSLGRTRSPLILAIFPHNRFLKKAERRLRAKMQVHGRWTAADYAQVCMHAHCGARFRCCAN